MIPPPSPSGAVRFLLPLPCCRLSRMSAATGCRIRSLFSLFASLSSHHSRQRDQAHHRPSNVLLANVTGTLYSPRLPPPFVSLCGISIQTNVFSGTSGKKHHLPRRCRFAVYEYIMVSPPPTSTQSATSMYRGMGMQTSTAGTGASVGQILCSSRLFSA